MELKKFDKELEMYGEPTYTEVVKVATEACIEMFANKEDPVEIIKAINAEAAEIFSDRRRVMAIKLSIDLGL